MSVNEPVFEGFFAKSLTRDELLHEMAAYLLEKGYVKEGYAEAVIARENIFPTGIPCEPISVAIPHCDRGFVNDTAVLVAKLAQPVTFNRIDDPDDTVDVDLAFMLAVNSDEGQLEMLGKIMDLIQNEELVRSVRDAATPDEISRLAMDAYMA